MFGTALLSLLAPIAVSAATTLSHRTIYSFPNTTYYDIENVAVRSNEQILLNLLSEPSIYTLDPAIPPQPQPAAQLLHTFPNATKLDGIVEYQPDVFAVVVGNTLSNGTSTYSLWSIDFITQPVSYTKLLDVPGAGALNGLTTDNGTYSDVLLIADAKLGAIWRVNLTSTTAEIAYQDPHFLPTNAVPFGINGVHTWPKDDKIYFSTSANNTFGFISPSNNHEVSIIATNIPENVDYDDFALAATSLRPNDQWAWVVAHRENLMKINLATGSQEVVLSGLKNPTSAALARCGNGADVLCCTMYVVTQGLQTNDTIWSGSVESVEIC